MFARLDTKLALLFAGSSSLVLAGVAVSRVSPGLTMGVGVAGMCVLAVAATLTARSITRRLAQLERAAGRIEEGDYTQIDVSSHDEIGRLAGALNHMTGAIEERARTITHLALHDRETDLPNREAFERQLAELTARGARVYVGVIGVNRFDQIRDAIGYRHVNTLVAQLGMRLGSMDALSRPARISADMLGVAFAARDDEEAERWMIVALEAVERPVELDRQSIDVSATAGFSQLSAPDATGQSGVERASIALDQARRAFRKAGSFDAAAYGDPMANLSLMGDMMRAFSNGDIFLAHQPKLNLRSGEIDGVEALIRWRHPVRGMIRPDLFVPMAEETGHIRALTDFVLAQAIKDQAAMAAAGHAVSMSVNISGRLVGDPDFTTHADGMLGEARGKIVFEITETAVMRDPNRALEQLRVFAERGVPISIDDYGSGLSSLAYLKMLPAQELKIDRGLLMGLSSSQREAFLLRSTIDLGHGLGMTVTAEGVEDAATLAIIRSLGCDHVQGYLIARPMALDALLQFLDDARAEAPLQRALTA